MRMYNVDIVFGDMRGGRRCDGISQTVTGYFGRVETRVLKHGIWIARHIAFRISGRRNYRMTVFFVDDVRIIQNSVRHPIYNGGKRIVEQTNPEVVFVHKALPFTDVFVGASIRA